MLLLYYVKTIILWLALPNSNSNPSFSKQLDKHDFEYLPREVCIAQCLGRTGKTISTTTTTSTSTSTSPLSATPPSTTLSPQPSTLPTAQLLKDALYHLENLKKPQQKPPLELCIEYCSKQNTARNENTTTVKQIHENYALNLICRDESSLNFRIHLHTIQAIVKNHSKKPEETDVTTMTTGIATDKLTNLSIESPSSMSVDHNDNVSIKDFVLFVIKIHLANATDISQVFLSDDEFFTLDQLLPNTTYNITVFAVHAQSQYSVISLGEQFSTLRRGYSPGNITHIKVVNFIEDMQNPTHLSASVIWKPPADMTCYYDVICFSPISNDFEMQPVEIRNPRQLYTYQLDNLTFSTEYKVGIRAKNIKNMKESELFWKTFYAPSCGEWHNFNFTVCAPEAPENVQYQLYYVAQNLYSLNISWNRPIYYPDNYTLSINDLSPFGQVYYFNISKNVNNFFIKEIEIYSAYIDVLLMASTVGGNATSLAVKNADAIIPIPEKNHFAKLFVIILAPIFCVALLSMTIFIVYYRRAKLKRYQERCKYFEELEKKAPIDPKDNFNFAISLTTSKRGPPNDLHISIEAEGNATAAFFNDEMEIERSELTLHEILGEGAFGLVKRGTYNNSRVQGAAVHEVAVKMLKDHPTADDVRAFRREIEVMKSVERHPNIVGILGHCTRFSNEMMLLTEYCSLGNLLNFLRDEWRFLHEVQQKQQQHTPGKLLAINLPQVLCGFEDTIDESLRNIRIKSKTAQSISPPTSPAPPPPPPPPPAELTNSPLAIFNNSQDASHVEELENTKNSQHKLSPIATEDKQKIKDTNNTQIIIDQFQRKYKGFKEHYKNNETANKIAVYSTGWKNKLHASLDSIKASTVKVNDSQIQMQGNSATISPMTSPATENKSYGYHGCCTNSCKCNVDVIIRNIDSSDSSKELDELDRLLQQQQDKKIQQNNSNKTCETTIAIKNCDCRKHAFRQRTLTPPSSTPASVAPNVAHKPKIAIENKSYFRIFNGTRQLTSHRKRSIRSESFRTTNSIEPTTNSLGSGSTSTNNEALTTFTTLSNENDDNAEDEDNWLQRVPLKSEDLLDISRQVAVGMDFLSKNKVVHRDLAARNVLVATDRTIKIADFGLSRDVYQENIYKKTGNGKLPIKWLALESLTHQVYTTQSDVWSYGILLYEIVTLGATPYPSIPTNRLLHLLKTGYRMDRPKNCGNKFYALMHSCWSAVPSERPTFAGIVKTLDNMLHDMSTSLQPLPSSEYPQSPIASKKINQNHLGCKEKQHNNYDDDDYDDDNDDADSVANNNNNDDDDDDDNDDNMDKVTNMEKQEIPILQIYPDDAYLNPLQ